MKLPEETAERLLDRWPIARLATLADDGAPHQVPVVFARAAARLWIPVDGKPKAGRELARVRHIRARPRACLLLDGYHEDWDRLWWLRVDADAEVLEASGADCDAALAALRAKYPQYRRTEILRPPGTLLALSPRRRVGWCATRAGVPVC